MSESISGRCRFSRSLSKCGCCDGGACACGGGGGWGWGPKGIEAMWVTAATASNSQFNTHTLTLSLPLSPLFSFFFALLYFLSLLSLFLFWFWFWFGYIKKHKTAYFLLRPTRLFVAVWITLQSPFFFLSFYVLNNNITSEYSFIILVGVVRACLPCNCIVVAQEAKSCSKFFVNLF